MTALSVVRRPIVLAMGAGPAASAYAAVALAAQQAAETAAALTINATGVLNFDTQAQLLADTSLGYAAGIVVGAGNTVNAGGARFTVLASDASSPDVTTAGGVKLSAVSVGLFSGTREVRVVAGALRNTGSGWAFISDSEHDPVGVVSVAIEDTIKLRVAFAGENVKVVSAVVGTDEAYARQGMVCGASVGTAYMDIQATLPFAFSLVTNGTSAPTVTAMSEIADKIVASRSGFKIRVTHPNIKVPPVVSRTVGSPDVVVDTLADGSFNLHQVSATVSYYYRVRYASGWQLLTNDTGASLDSSTFASNGNLTVTLGTALTGNDFAFQSVSNRYNPGKIVTSGTSSFMMRFYDEGTGAVITTAADTSMESYVLYGPPVAGLNASTTLPAGTYHVQRGRVLVDWADIVSTDSYGANSNLWFIALVEVG